MQRSVKAPEETRMRILKSAFQEFYRNGFQGASLNQIIASAGVTKGALFHHFDGKQALGYAVVEEVIEASIRAEWVDPLSKSVDPLLDIKNILLKMTEHHAHESVLFRGCPLNNLAQEMSPLDEGFRLRVERVYKAWREAAEAALARGIQTGHVRKNVNPGNVAVFLVASITGVVGSAKNAQCPKLMSGGCNALIDYLDTLKP